MFLHNSTHSEMVSKCSEVRWMGNGEVKAGAAGRRGGRGLGSFNGLAMAVI